MRILFVVKSKTIETLGVQYLAAVVKQAGHEAKIVEIEDAIHHARLLQPDIIGFSVMTGSQERVIKVAGAIKNLWPKGKKKPMIIVGGPHATFFPKDFEDDPNIDMIIPGEAEQAIADLLESGIKYGGINSLPWPDRTDFQGHVIRDFIASRGCTNACNYCYNEAWSRLFPALRKVRTRHAKDVVEEVRSTNPEFVYFQDSTFGINTTWLREFSQHYRRYVNAPYHVHMRPDQITPERVLLLHDSNCVSMKTALETASGRLRKLINRGNTNNADMYAAAKLLKKWGIALIMQNILGLPTATIEDDLETLEVNIKCKPAYAWSSIFQPYPATKLALFCEGNKLYTGDYSEIGDNFFDKSVLNISPEQKEQVACLQRIFAFCVEMQIMPKIEDLTWERLPKFIHNAMRRIGDDRMFPSISSRLYPV